MVEYAVPRYMRGEDGGLTVSYIDTNTLQPVTDMTGYAQITPANIQVEDLPYADMPQGTAPVADPEEAADMEEQGKIPPRKDSGRQNMSEAPQGMKDRARNAENNYGYVDKPGWAGFISGLPGPLGLVGKMANFAINAENVKALEAKNKDEKKAPMKTIDQMKSLVMGVKPEMMDKEVTAEEEAATDPDPSQGLVDAESLGPAADVTDTGTKQGLAGKFAGIDANEVGTVPDMATPESMAAMPNISAPLGIDSVNETTGLARMAAPEAVNPAEQSAVAPSFSPTTTETTGIASPATPADKPGKQTAAKTAASVAPSEAKTNALGVDTANTVSARSKAALQADAEDKGYGSVVGNPNAIGKLDDTFSGRMQAMSENFGKLGMGTIGAFSATRSPEHQAGIVSGMMGKYGFSKAQVAAFNKDVAEKGAVEAGKAWAGSLRESGLTAKAAPPGMSMHQKGLATDMSWTDPQTGKTVSIGRAPKAVQDAIAAEGKKVGLATPVANEPWHFEKVETRKPEVETFGIQAVPESLAPTPMDKPSVPSETPMAEAPTDTPGMGFAALGYSPTEASEAGTFSGAMTPSQFSAVGLGRQYSPNEQSQMSQTVAGEMGPTGLKGLAVSDPEARAEAASIMGVMDDRMNSKQYAAKEDQVGAALNPTDFNANMTSPLGPGKVAPSVTRDANYSQFGFATDQAMSDYQAGSLATTTPGASHYAASYASPSWAGPDQTAVGAHSFGSAVQKDGVTRDSRFDANPDTYGSVYGPVGAIGLGAIGTEPGGQFATGPEGPSLGAVTAGVEAEGSKGLGNPSGYSIGPSTSTEASGAIGNTQSSVGSSGVAGLGGVTSGDAATGGMTGSTDSGSTGADSSSDSGSSGGSGSSAGTGGFGGGYGGTAGNSPGGATGFGGMGGGVSSGASSGSTGSSGGGFGGGYGGAGSGSGSANSGDNR